MSSITDEVALLKKKKLHLKSIFHYLNDKIFDSELSTRTVVRWSKRLRVNLGNHTVKDPNGPGVIHLNRKLLYKKSLDLIIDVLIHEMIHAWVRIYCDEEAADHGPEFQAKMQKVNEDFGRDVQVRFSHDDVNKAIERLRLKYGWYCNSCFHEVYRAINNKPHKNSSAKHQLDMKGQCKGEVQWIVMREA